MFLPVDSLRLLFLFMSGDVFGGRVEKVGGWMACPLLHWVNQLFYNLRICMIEHYSERIITLLHTLDFVNDICIFRPENT